MHFVHLRFSEWIPGDELASRTTVHDTWSWDIQSCQCALLGARQFSKHLHLYTGKIKSGDIWTKCGFRHLDPRVSSQSLTSCKDHATLLLPCPPQATHRPLGFCVWVCLCMCECASMHEDKKSILAVFLNCPPDVGLPSVCCDYH